MAVFEIKPGQAATISKALYFPFLILMVLVELVWAVNRRGGGICYLGKYLPIYPKIKIDWLSVAVRLKIGFCVYIDTF